MKSEINKIKKLESFPCLMEYKIQGGIPVGIYLVSEVPGEGRFSVCLVAPHSSSSKIGEMYFKKELNQKEWSFLPIGTSVKLVN